MIGGSTSLGAKVSVELAMDPNAINAKIVQVISEKEELKCPVVEHQFTSKKGDGYMSVINAVKLKGSNKSLDLVFKRAPTNEKLRKAIFTRDAFLQEITFYDEVLTYIKTFQEELRIREPFDNYPRCYLTYKEPLEELLVLENLKSDGYEMRDRKCLMDTAHMELMINTYAKFHATAFALKQLRPEQYKRLKNSLRYEGGDIFLILMDKIKMIDEMKGYISYVNDIFDKKTEYYYFEKMKEFGESAKDINSKLMQKGDFEVFSQGDCWSNNMLFKYGCEGDKKVPLEIKLIDFQITYSRSAFLDLSYLFYGHASKKELDNLDHHLELYYDSLAAHLSKFGLDVNDILPHDKLWELWSEYCPYGILWCFLIRKAMLGSSEEVPDFDKIAEEGGNIESGFAFKLSNEKEYREQLKDIMKHAIDRNFI